MWDDFLINNRKTRLLEEEEFMSPFRTKRRWQEGTYMRLASCDRLKTFVYTKADLDAYRAGKPIDGRKMTQSKLASRAGVSRSFIAHLVSGYRSSCKPETAERISEVLGLDVTVLFDPETSISICQSA